MPAAVRDIRCSIQRSLDVLGEKWALLVVREAVWGKTRFAEFRQRLGVAPDILTDRLRKLVDWDILERQPYRDEGERERDEYVLTETGRELIPVLAALSEWGDEHRPSGHGHASSFRDAATGRAARLAFVDSDGRDIPLDSLEIIPGPEP